MSDPTRHCRYFLRADQAAVAAWLALAACCPPAFAQNTSPVQATSPQGTSGSLPQHLCGAIPPPIQSGLLPVAPVVLPGSPVFAQSSLNPPEEKPSEKERPISYGAEIALSSGHADRGIVISDRPVVQPEVWVSGKGVKFSLWSNFPLTETTDGSRPQILEMELTREHEVQPCLCRHRQISAQSHKRGGLADGSRQAALPIGPASRVQHYRGPYGMRGAGTAGFTTGVEF